MVNDKPTWTLVAHAGTVAHSHLMVSLVQAHYINQGIRENKKLSVNVVDESWLKDADRMGTISGNKVDKSEAFAWTMGENGAPLIDEAKVSMAFFNEESFPSPFLLPVHPGCGYLWLDCLTKAQIIINLPRCKFSIKQKIFSLNSR